MENKKTFFHILRVGLAITFLWIGILILQSPVEWGAYLLPWAAKLLFAPIKETMIVVGTVDILIGFFLLIDTFVAVAALMGALHLIVVLTVSGINPVTVRDIGLLASMIALMLEAAPERVWTKLGIEKLIMLEGRSHADLVEHNLDYNYITDGIFIGTNQCCQTHFNLELLQKGIEADISLEENKMDMPFGVNFYLWLPVKNHTALAKDQLDLGVKTLTELINAGKKVYIHCKSGHGRAPTFVAAYLIKNKQMSVNKAIELIRASRPTIDIEKVQIKSLEEFADNLSK